MNRKIYQAGYAHYVGYWRCCGYGKTIEEARADLQRRIRERDASGDFRTWVESGRYIEQSFWEAS